MEENICYKFGTPQNQDLLELQNLCNQIVCTNEYTQNLLMFIGFNILLFLVLIFFIRLFARDKDYIQAYYRVSYPYYMQIFMVFTIVPALAFLFEHQFHIVSKIFITIGLFTVIFLKFEFWPALKNEPRAQGHTFSSILVALFTISYYFAFSLGIYAPEFTESILLVILSLYLILLSIVVRLIKEIKHIEPSN